MKSLNLDHFEQDILESVENDEWQSKSDINIRLTELQSFLKHENKKPFQSSFLKKPLRINNK